MHVLLLGLVINVAMQTPGPTLGSDTSAAAAPMADAPPRVLVLDLMPRNVDEATARLATGIISATADADARFTVDTVADLRAMANVEASKMELGCDVDSCLAEMAQAMGARFIVYGDIGALGDLLVVNLNIYDAAGAKSVARRSLEAKNPAQLPDVIRPAVTAMLAAAAPSPSAGPTQQTNAATHRIDTTPLLRPSTAVLVTGAALALSGGGVAAFAEWRVGQRFGPAEQNNLDWRRTGLLALGVSAVGVLTGIAGGVMLAMEDPTKDVTEAATP